MNTFPAPAGEPHGSPGSLAGAGPEGAGGGGACPSPAPSLTAISVRAMEDVMAKRAEQIRKYGHTPEADARLPLRHFVAQLQRGAIGIAEDAQFRVDREIMRGHVVRHAALCLALIDRLDAEAAGESPKDGFHG